MKVSCLENKPNMMVVAKGNTPEDTCERPAAAEASGDSLEPNKQHTFIGPHRINQDAASPWYSIWSTTTPRSLTEVGGTRLQVENDADSDLPTCFA